MHITGARARWRPVRDALPPSCGRLKARAPVAKLTPAPGLRTRCADRAYDSGSRPACRVVGPCPVRGVGVRRSGGALAEHRHPCLRCSRRDCASRLGLLPLEQRALPFAMISVEGQTRPPPRPCGDRNGCRRWLRPCLWRVRSVRDHAPRARSMRDRAVAAVCGV